MILVIDGNAILNVITNVVIYGIRGNSNFDLSYINVGGRIILKDSSKQFFRNSMLKYLTSIITPFGRRLDEIYFAFDSVSWRKFYINKHFERHPDMAEFAYKGHKKDDEYKRELFMFFSYFNEEILPELLALDGIHTIKVKGAEGDDVLAVLNDILPGDKILWTVDSDINQLVSYANGFTIVIGPKNKGKLRRLVLPHGYDRNACLIDFDVDNFGICQLAKYLVAEKEYEITVVEPNSFIMRKILVGDPKSDNIPSVLVRISPTGRRMGITEAKADKILSAVESKFPVCEWMSKIDANDTDFISEVIRATVEATSANSREKEEITAALNLNRRVIRLSPNVIPAEIVKMITYKYSILDRSKRFSYNQYLEYAYINEP